jgi:oxygen-independent coproporphyrinogen-3 oxidase
LVTDEMLTPSVPDIDQLESLIARHARPGPRYTSYPTAPLWTPAFGAAEHERALRGCSDAEALSLYAHIPFCRSLCHFCACNRVITRDEALPRRYLAAIEREVARTRALFDRVPPAAQLHWGGGTPTHLDPESLERLFRAMTDAFPLAADAEVSIEVDPRVTTDAQLDVLADCGFDRISLGVQDTSPKTQQAIHRIQPFEITRRVTEHARARGITGVNFDLVYGLPHQTTASFRRTIEEVLELAPDRIALYGYAHVTWVAKQQRGFERIDLPGPSERLQIQLQAIEQLTAAGYRFIGMDHFARPEDDLARALDDGSLRRNFMGYTTRDGLVTLGFGPSGISELPAAYAQNRKDLPAWLAAIDAGELPTERGFSLSKEDLARRALIRAVLCDGHVDVPALAARHGSAVVDAYRDGRAGLAPFLEDGLVELLPDDLGLQVTPTGRLFLRGIAMVFDAYLDPPDAEASDRPRYSQTI